MPRQVLAVSTLLIVFVACRDEPTGLAAPVEAPMTVTPEVTVPENALTTVLQLFDDPFVLELMDGIGADATALRSAARDASISRTTEHVLTLSSALTQTRSGLLAPAQVAAGEEEENPDEEILRAALELVLDDAVSLLESRRPSAEDEEQEEEQLDVESTTEIRSLER